MTPEEIKAAEEVRIAEEIATNPLTKAQEELRRVSEERDNYKKVALKRLGKLPGDAEFIAGDTENGELSVEEQVRLALLDREIQKTRESEQFEMKRIVRENAELRLAAKSKSDMALGGDSGSGAGATVKDSVFSEAQLADLRKRAERLKADPEKFIESARANILKRS